MMRLITAPAAVVSVPEVKRHLRVDHTDDDAYISGLIAAATAWIDGANGWLGRAIGIQKWELQRCGFGPGCSINLPLAPLVSVEAVSYTAVAGASQTFSEYRVLGIGTSGAGGIYLAAGSSWPTTSGDPDSVRIEFTAGYEAVPAPIKHAILLMVGHYYENREAITAEKPDVLPMGVDALLMPYRIWTV